MRSLGVLFGHRATLYMLGEHVDMDFNNYVVHVNILRKMVTGIEYNFKTCL